MPQLPNADPLLILAVTLVIGVAFGGLTKRLRLPAVTGQVVAGALIGRMGFELFDQESIRGLQPLTHFALGLIAVTVGAHLNLRRLRNAGKRLFLLLLCEAIIIPTLVFSGLVLFPDIDWTTALLFGTLAVSTAPATIVAIVKETRSKGVFVKTLVAAVALNNMICIFLFEMARLIAHASLGATDIVFGEVLKGASVQLASAATTGAVAALGMAVITRLVKRPELLSTAGVIALLLTLGIAHYLGYSPLLACLFLGLTQANVTRDRDQVLDTLFANFEPAILAVFFTLAGMELTLEHAARLGFVALAFFSLRALGKVLAGRTAMRLAGATEKLRRNIGPALIPQAGVAVGLVILLEGDTLFLETAPGILDLFVGVVLTAVVANEIVGPVLTRLALVRSGEVGREQPRLMDFIYEENIVTNLRASTMEEAIRRLTDLLLSSHNLPWSMREPLLESTLAREKEMSTCLGGGLAVPHGILPQGQPLVGAMGLHKEGFAFETPDGRPVHCIVLLATPPERRQRHLQILGTLARTIGADPVIQTQLFNAESPAHAYEILTGEATDDFNLLLEEVG